MKKPIQPVKYSYQPRSSIFSDIDYSCNQVSLDYLLDWIKRTVPKNAVEVRIGIAEQFDDYGEGIISSNIRIYWKDKILNKQYDKQLEKYKVKLAKWKDQQNNK